MKSIFIKFSYVLTVLLFGGASYANNCGDFFSSSVVKAKKPRTAKPKAESEHERLRALIDANPEAKKAAEDKRQELAEARNVTPGQVAIKATQQTYKFLDLIDPNPATNIFAAHPATLVTAAQKYAMIVNLGKESKTVDPVYKVRPLITYGAFNGDLPGADGRLIVGQEGPVAEVVSHIRSQASGNREGKVPLLVGPHGTGKTELLMVLDSLIQHAQNTNPLFYEYTFEWMNISDIPALSPLIPKQGGVAIFDSLKDDLGDSPFVLLTEELQNKVLDTVSAAIQEKTGFKVNPQRAPANPKTAEILHHLFSFYIPALKEGEITIEDIPQDVYLNILNKHVKLVRKTSGTNAPSNIVRAVPENPKFSLLFASEDLRRKMFYPANSPLMYDFTGKVLSRHRGSVSLDEFFRNDVGLINLYLELFQNGIMETDTGPAVKLDTVAVLTSNDESVAKSSEDGAIKAIIDRMTKIGMRWDVHPYRVAKIALLLVGPKNFSMKPLPQGDEVSVENMKFVPVVEKTKNGVVNRLNELVPNQDKEGNIPSISGRYAMSVTSNGQQVFIAPHVLEMLGLVVSATRLVTDAKEMQPYWDELNVMNAQSAIYTSVKQRLDVILGKTKPEKSILLDLTKMHDLVKEGKDGISARDSKRWLELAINYAISRGNGVLTPYILDMAFKDLMDKGEFEIPKGKRTDWLGRYMVVKSDFVLPALERDIRNIVSGDGDRAIRIYDEVEKEIIALSQNPNAKEYVPDDASEAQPINRDRLNTIYKFYRSETGQEFNAGFLMRHLASVQTAARRVPDAGLLRAVSAYLASQEINITEGVGKLKDYYNGQTSDPKVEILAREAEARYAKHGYDRQSFIEAVQYMGRLKAEKEKSAKK